MNDIIFFTNFELLIVLQFWTCVLVGFFKGFHPFINYNDQLCDKTKSKKIDADRNKQHNKIQYRSEAHLKKNPGDNL